MLKKFNSFTNLCMCRNYNEDTEEEEDSEEEDEEESEEEESEEEYRDTGHSCECH